MHFFQSSFLSSVLETRFIPILYVAIVCSFYLLYGIPFYKHTVIYFPMLMLMNAYFQFWALGNSSTMHIISHVFLCIFACIPDEYNEGVEMPILRLYIYSAVVVNVKLGSKVPISTPNSIGDGPGAPTTPPDIISLLKYKYSDGCTVITYYSLKLHFSMSSDVENFFICHPWLAIWSPSLRYLSHLCIFCWVAGIFLIDL